MDFRKAGNGPMVQICLCVSRSLILRLLAVFRPLTAIFNVHSTVWCEYEHCCPHCLLFLELCAILGVAM